MVKTSGTREWAYKNLNIFYGCSNNCTYCYAKRMWERFRKGKPNRYPWEWDKYMTNFEAINKGYRKLNNPNPELFDYMFPTSHDITTENIYGCIIVLKKVLRAGNTVLITTKPNYDCIVELCKELRKWRDKILFRFTITSHRNEILKKYEPNAPNDASRLFSLKHAFEKGFKTSISIEPFLDKDPIHLIKALYKWVTNGIWLGIMSGAVPQELKGNYTRENVLKIIENIKKLPENIKKQIKLKDSIRNLIGVKEIERRGEL